ncbi:MAG: LysM peptidoglycan-binding domain-containing protein [Phycisphaerae bacterium]
MQAGDTIASLAVAYYGHEKYVQFLIDQNPQVKDVRRLRIGSRIKIPPRPKGGSAARTLNARRALPVDKGAEDQRTYRVRPGDTFYAIARSVLSDASRWEEIFALNRALVKGDPKNLQVGQVLVLPDS